MKILILDDLPTRHKAVQKLHTDDEVVNCFDIWAAQKAANEQPFDMWYLDYDLNDYHEDSIIEDNGKTLYLTGLDFITWCAINVPSENLPKQVVIISIDKKGAEEMLWVLKHLDIPVEWHPLPN